MQAIKLFKSLQFKTVLNIVLALGIALLVFVCCFATGDAFNKNIINTDESIRARKYSQIDTFVDYVLENDINSYDHDKLKDWCDDHNYRLVMFDDGKTYVISPTNVVTYDELIYDAEFIVSSVEFADTVMRVSVIGMVDDIGYAAVIIVSFVVAALVFLLIILLNLRVLMNRIITLSEEVIDIRHGNLDRQIDSRGNDELSILASNVDKMRVSIIKHYEAEKHALKSNTELLTSISHDIRTPLTALTGYAEVMADEQITDIEEMRTYARVCRDKAYQLKDLTDTLFRYFLVYGDVDVTPKLKDYSLPELISSVVDNHVDYLKQRGYHINYQKNIPDDSIINTDIMLQKRLFDNIFSNISKYAQKDGIIVTVNVVNNKLEVSCENRIDRTVTGAESTGIGLKSCKKLVSLLNGNMISKTRNGFFYTDISFVLL